MLWSRRRATFTELNTSHKFFDVSVFDGIFPDENSRWFETRCEESDRLIFSIVSTPFFRFVDVIC